VLPLLQVLLQWRATVGYQQRLAAAFDRLAALAPRLRLRHSLQRWQRVAQALAGQRSEELRRLVQARACLG
jgi:hypothetical protein